LIATNSLYFAYFAKYKELVANTGVVTTSFSFIVN